MLNAAFTERSAALVNAAAVRLKTFLWFVAAVTLVFLIVLAFTQHGGGGLSSWLRHIPGH